MRSATVEFNADLIRRALARVVSNTFSVTVRNVLLVAAAIGLFALSGSASGMIAPSSAAAVGTGIVVTLFAGSLILLNARWQSSKYALDAHRRKNLKMEVEFNNDGCQVTYGDWSKVLPWHSYVGSIDCGDFALLKFWAEGRATAQELKSLAEDVAKGRGLNEALGFPILCIPPVAPFRFVIVPKDMLNELPLKMTNVAKSLNSK